ncbi:MAG: NAD-dependent epimerase/dehydratase family protein [Bryobacterales bacterium]|nr:NAD-dependent epimerase/dehydratase family protein [Bryobacterales bacterium]
MRVLILGCGYTGRRVAKRLCAQGHEVWVTARHTESLLVDGARTVALPELGGLGPGLRILHSVPLTEGPSDPTSALLGLLPPGVARIVYLSTTSVYGGQHEVDEHTEPAPTTPQARLRVAAEHLVLAGPWSSMVLRPAAIYGPGRGAHVSIPNGQFRLMGDGTNYVSRIHVDDLAALAAAAVLSEEGGAWPVADLEPAQSRAVAEFVCHLLGCPMPASASGEQLHETRRADRKVRGEAVFRVLGLDLKYPSFREGIPSALSAGLL